MTKRDFFMLTIKLFGLFAVIKSLFEFIPMMIISPDPRAIYVYIELTATVIVLSLILIFKSDKIVHLFKLDKGFEEEWMGFENITSVGVVKIGTFIIGGLLFVQNVPQFLIQSYNALSYDANDMQSSAFNGKVMVLCCLNLAVGYLLITNYQFVSKILNREKELDEEISE
jgi:hypothetical protein